MHFSPETKPLNGIRGRNGNGCPRCGFAVYAAEQMISKNKVSYKWRNNKINLKENELYTQDLPEWNRRELQKKIILT